ncbi:MAG: hypothetical protein ACRDP4_08080, partial [Nocardioidaceae bacterium]
MTPSAQHAPEPWGDHPQEFDLLAQEPTPPLPVDPGAPYDQLAPADDGTAYQAETGEVVDEGDVDTRLEGPADESTEYD